MARLYLRCKTCNVEFASGISVDEKSFETMVLSGNQHACTKGHLHEYDKKDYFKAISSFKEFLKEAFIPWSPNPGLKLTGIITLLGISLFCVSMLLEQLGYGPVNPIVLEIGKAAFYFGIGRASPLLDS